MSIVSGIDCTVLILGAGIAIAICIAAGLVAKKIRNRARDNLHKMALDPLQTSHSVKEIPADTHEISSDQDRDFSSAPLRKEIDCLQDKVDITQSLVALAEKYSLDEITIATSDGLLLASSLKAPSADNIARYCKMYTINSRPWPPGTMLFGVEHKGSFLVVIAKTKDPLLQEPDPELVYKTKDILNWWI